jgi:hypothetical protein
MVERMAALVALGRGKKGELIMVTRIWIFAALLGILILPLHGATASEKVVPSSEAAQTIVINDLTVREGSVSGTIVNKSSATVRGVALLLRQAWLWNDEHHPGTDNPGRTLPLTFAADVAPHASAPFTFQIPPMPQRSDGRFVTTMDVTGFTEVGP